MKKSFLILLVVVFILTSVRLTTAEANSASSDLGFIRCGILFGDNQQTVSQKEKISLREEKVDGVSAVWTADTKLFGLSNSSVSYLFDNDGKLFEIYEYFDDKASISKGKSNYATVQNALVDAMGMPLPKDQHVTLVTPGFDVDDYVSTLKKLGANISISERNMWIIELDNHSVTVDHIGVSLVDSDIYKHYLFAVAQEKPDEDISEFDWPTIENNYSFPGGYKLCNADVTPEVTIPCEGTLGDISVSNLSLYLDTIRINFQDPTNVQQGQEDFNKIEQELKRVYYTFKEPNDNGPYMMTLSGLIALNSSGAKCIDYNRYYDSETSLSIEHIFWVWNNEYGHFLYYEALNDEK